MIPLLQAESLAITIVTLALSAVLTAFLFASYRKGRRSSLMFWGLGLAAFTAGVFLEVLFALGIYSMSLVDIYLFIVALLVELLALGSMELLSSKTKKRAYQAFCIASTMFLVAALAASGNVDIVQAYVAYLPPSLLVTVASTAMTFPAAIILIWVALISYIKTKSVKMLSIIAGVVLVSIAGTLYIVSFPSLLYISEFIGILLLWVGFYSRQARRGRSASGARRHPPPH